MTIVNGAQAITEDFSRVGGFIAGCGQASAYVIAHIIKGEPLSTSELTQIIQDSINAGKAGVHGSTPAGSLYVLNKFGIQAQESHVAPSQLGSFLTNEINKGIPIEIGVNQGHFLSNEQSGLHGHYVTIVGVDTSGNFITADPNAPQAKSGGFTTNTLSQILSADPFAEITPMTGVGVNANGITGTPQNVTIPNPLDIASAIQQLPQNLVKAITSPITNLWSQLGITGINDVGWRTALIIGGFIIAVLGIIIFAYDLLDKSNIEVAGSRI